MKTALFGWLLLWALCAVSLSISDVCYCGDQSALIEDASAIAHGKLITAGPASRGGMHHPGSAYQIILAALFVASAGSLFAMNLLHAGLVTCGLFFLLRTASRESGSLMAAAALMLVYLGLPFSYRYALMIWGPAVNIMLFSGAVYCAIRTVSGDHEKLRWLAVLVSILLQTHFGNLFVCAGLVLAVLAIARPDKRGLRDFAIWATAASLPAILDALRHPENLRAILASAGQMRSFLEVRNAIAELHGGSPWLWGILCAAVVLSPSLRSVNRRAAAVLLAAFLCAAAGMFFIWEPIQIYYLAHIPILTLSFAALFRGRTALWLAVIALAFAPAAARISEHWKPDWNPCPLGEVRGVARALEGRMAETEGSTIPMILPSLLRETGPLSPSTDRLLLEAPVSAGDGEILFSGRAMRLIRKPAK